MIEAICQSKAIDAVTRIAFWETHRIRYPFLSLLVAATVLGCATTTPRPVGYARTVTPQFATLVNADVTIASAGGRWEIRAGERSRPGVYDFGGGVITQGVDGFESVVGHSGAHEVTIKRGEETFRGILVLLKVHPTAPPAARNRWAIEIPGQYFSAARNGGVSYVRGTYTHGGDSLSSWMLWFSDIRFW